MINQWLGKTALSIFKKVDDGISDTQRAALESGTVGFEGSIFSGKPDWKGLLNTPAPELTEEEQSFLDNETEELCRMIDDWQIREDKDIPPPVMDFIKAKKFFGMIIPKEYGGLGFSAYAHACVVSKLATRSMTVAATVMVPNSLGPGEINLHYGTEDQKDYFLPRLADGREVPCFSLTSIQAGSDATNIKDEGVLFRDDDGEIKIRLTWDKRYITLAPIATLYGLAFRLKDPDHLIGDKEDVGITLGLLPRDTPGFNVGYRHRPMGTPFQNGPHWGTDVVVPLERTIDGKKIPFIIGGNKMAGRGWDMLVDCLSIGRSISLPASSAGMARYATRVTGAYAAVRQQFASSLSGMEGVQEPLARIGGLTYLIDSARLLPLQDLDLAAQAGKSARPAVASAILKYHTTESARRIIIDSMDVHGGKGVMEGSNNPIGGLYQGVPVGITVEGANIMTRNLMIFGQGAFMAHPYVMAEMKAARNGDSDECARLAKKHIAHVFNNSVRSFFGSLTNGTILSTPKNNADSKYYKRLNRLSAAFAVASDISMATLQGSLKWRERTSALLGDVLSNVYMGAQVMRRWELEGKNEAERPLMEWAVKHCIQQAEDSLYEAIQNHPSSLARMVLKPLCFPLGQVSRWNSKPSHKLDAAVSKLITTPGPVRNNLTNGPYSHMFIPKDGHEYIARLEHAFELAQKAAPHEKALGKAVKAGQLSQSENVPRLIDEALEKKVILPEIAGLLREMDAARCDINQVDYFPSDWHGEPMQRYPSPLVK